MHRYVYVYIKVESDKVYVIKYKILENMVEGYKKLPVQFLQIFSKLEINFWKYK